MSISLFPGVMASQFQLVLTPSGKPPSGHKGISGFFCLFFFLDKSN